MPEMAPADERVLRRRATTTIAVLTAGAVAVVVTAVLLLVLFLTNSMQRSGAERILGQAAAAADDVSGPPPEITILIRRGDGPVRISQPVPAALVGVDLAGLAPGFGDLSAGGHTYSVFVDDRGGDRIVAALDQAQMSAERMRLMGAILPAGLAGILAAAIIGWLVARRATRPLGDALALQRRFVADASHELRTPLAILQTRAQLLCRREVTDPGLREHLDRLVDDSRALAAIVDDLLLSAQLALRPTGREEVDLAELAQVVVDSFDGLAGDAGVTIVVQASSPVVVVAGVPAALRRAVSALVDNALAHTPPGGSVMVRVGRRDGMVELAVADDGEGLDPSEISRLTQRFARGRNASGQGRRFGLGLALVGEVVQAHGGELTLDGQLGAGATATMTLPAATRPDPVRPISTVHTVRS